MADEIRKCYIMIKEAELLGALRDKSVIARTVYEEKIENRHRGC